jgi:predicted RNA-binding Zn-ribbon protein involved in translation (DUF1610 family)
MSTAKLIETERGSVTPCCNAPVAHAEKVPLLFCPKCGQIYLPNGKRVGKWRFRIETPQGSGV